MTDYGLAIFDQHAKLLEASTIPPEHAHTRGYVSVDTKTRLEGVGVTKAGRNIPGLLIPLLRKDGSTWGYQYRPDNPRTNGAGKAVKYETPTGQRNGIDVPPGVGPMLDDPAVPLWVTEGAKKADAAACAGLACVALAGVWSWRGTNVNGGKVAVPDWHDIALNDRQVVLAFDSDVVRKHEVRGALVQLAGYLTSKGAAVRYLHLPDDEDGKTGLDDYLGAGHTVDDLRALVRPEPPAVKVTEAAAPPAPRTPTPPASPMTLEQAHKVYRHWLGAEYDLDALNATLVTAAVERLTGDPLWLLLISGSGNAKTETVQALDGTGAIIASTITSDAALLSGTPKKDRTTDATGGLLCELGTHGTLVIKDVTSILSMNGDARSAVLAALREVYDGRWIRRMGADGGRVLDWSGRVAVIGAVTTAWDRAHAVISQMGDRFVLLRMDSTTGRQVAGRRAIGNTGSETRMRADLAAAVAGVLAGINRADTTPTDDERDILLAAADVVTLARTGVDYDYRGDVIDCHALEMPTRFAKQLTQIVRGGVAIGMDRHDALRLAIRCARDSMPPLRLAILDDIAAHPASPTRDVRQRLGKPRATVDRQLQALHMLGALRVDEMEETWAGRETTVWRYSLTDGIDPHVLNPGALPDSERDTPTPIEEGTSDDVAGDVPREYLSESGKGATDWESWPPGTEGAAANGDAS